MKSPQERNISRASSHRSMSVGVANGSATSGESSSAASSNSPRSVRTAVASSVQASSLDSVGRSLVVPVCLNSSERVASLTDSVAFSAPRWSCRSLPSGCGWKAGSCDPEASRAPKVTAYLLGAADCSSDGSVGSGRPEVGTVPNQVASCSGLSRSRSATIAAARSALRPASFRVDWASRSARSSRSSSQTSHGVCRDSRKNRCSRSRTAGVTARRVCALRSALSAGRSRCRRGSPVGVSHSHCSNISTCGYVRLARFMTSMTGITVRLASKPQSAPCSPDVGRESRTRPASCTLIPKYSEATSASLPCGPSAVIKRHRGTPKWFSSTRIWSAHRSYPAASGRSLDRRISYTESS